MQINIFARDDDANMLHFKNVSLFPTYIIIIFHLFIDKNIIS